MIFITKRHPSVMTSMLRQGNWQKCLRRYPEYPTTACRRFFIEDKGIVKTTVITRRTLQNFRNANIIPYYKIGGKTFTMKPR